MQVYNLDFRKPFAPRLFGPVYAVEHAAIGPQGGDFGKVHVRENPLWFIHFAKGQNPIGGHAAIRRTIDRRGTPVDVHSRRPACLPYGGGMQDIALAFKRAGL